MSNHNDPAATLITLVLVMALAYLAVIGAIIIIATLAVLVIGWYLTHLLFAWLNQISEGQLLAEHGGLLLILSGGLWAFVAWVLVPQAWINTITMTLPWLYRYPYLAPIIGGILGLAWSMLVLFVAEQDEEVSPLDVAGMYSLGEHELLTQDAANNPDTIDLLTDSVILGTDV